MIDKLNGWIGQITELGMGLLGLAIVAALLAGDPKKENALPFFGDVVTNITNLVSQLGGAGLAGLIALGVVLWLFNRK